MADDLTIFLNKIKTEIGTFSSAPMFVLWSYSYNLQIRNMKKHKRNKKITSKQNCKKLSQVFVLRFRFQVKVFSPFGSHSICTVVAFLRWKRNEIERNFSLMGKKKEAFIPNRPTGPSTDLQVHACYP